MIDKKLKINKKKGVTLFITISVVSILLFITYAVANITMKSSLFAASARDSQFAFYAADAGMECALYWDTRFNESYFDFSTSTNPGSIRCGGLTLTTASAISGTTTTTRIGGEGVNNRVSVFGFVMSQGNNPVYHCTIVTVIKRNDGTTYIKSRGYNTCLNSARRVERGIEVTY